MTANKEIQKLIKDFATKKGNIFHAERLFVANTVLNWAFQNYKDEKTLRNYIFQVERHLNGEITLYWENDVIKVKNKKKNGE